MSNGSEFRTDISSCKWKKDHVAKPGKRDDGQHDFTGKDMGDSHYPEPDPLVVCPKPRNNGSRNDGENNKIRCGG